MSATIKIFLALGLATGAVAVSAPSASAAKYHTPVAGQSLFYEDQLSGKRSVVRRRPTPEQRRLYDAAPALPVVDAATGSAASTAVYFSAHQDDFVLFMYPHRDVTSSDTNAVFIFMTAGDAGLGSGPYYAPYYSARESGALRAIRFMADATTTYTASSQSKRVTINGHQINRTVYKNTTAFFLRLPDGNGDGEGFSGTGNASMQKLMTGRISSLKAVDGSTTYKGWNDLVQTLGAIVKSQAAGTPNVWLDIPETDTAANPGDHSDHIATGLAAAALQTTMPCLGLVHHVGYSNAGLVNMDLTEIEDKAGAFANYTSALAEKGYPGVSWGPGHQTWLGGMVLRIVPGNGGACTF